jgi:tRNA threonylcarbamoyl adenosine modification protein (Sua5/YciO/YrdC/YwlC family)
VVQPSVGRLQVAPTGGGAQAASQTSPVPRTWQDEPVIGADRADKRPIVPVILTWDDPRLIESVDAVLLDDQCFVLPTDTVYGIAAAADSATAIQRLQGAKGRDDRYPPPVLIADVDDLAHLTGDLSPQAQALADAYWPGPLTLILDQAPDAAIGFGPGMGRTIAVRLPAHEPLRRLLRHTGPLATSSANRHDQPAAMTVAEAVAGFDGRVGLYIDGGPTRGRTPSSIVSFTDDPAGRLLRQGGVAPADLERLAPGLGTAWTQAGPRG